MYKACAYVLLANFSANITVNLPLRRVLRFLLSAVRRSFHLSKRSAFLTLWMHRQISLFYYFDLSVCTRLIHGR